MNKAGWCAVAAFITTSADALAQTPPPPAPVEEAPVETSRVWIGAALDLPASGEIHLSADSMGMTFSETQDLNSPIRVGGFIEARVSPYITLGFAPRVLLDVKVEGEDVSGREYDLRGRARIGANVAPQVNLHGTRFLTLGAGVAFGL